MQSLKLCFMSLGVMVLTNALALAQTTPFFQFTTGTGNNATIAVPPAANPNIAGASLISGDEIGVFTPAGLCVGAAVWTTGQSAAITVWGDNDQTPAIDGIKSGEEMRYRLWRKTTNSMHLQLSATYAQGDGKYAVNGIYIVSAVSAVSTSVKGETAAATAKNFILLQNYPNPFNPATAIRYSLPQASAVTLKIFNMAGQEVETLVNRQQEAGAYTLPWNAEKLPSGVYLYRLQAEGFAEMKKMILLR